MNLEAWLSQQNMSDDDFASLAGVDRTTVSRWKRGKRFPKPAQLARVAELTNGAVTAGDFVELSTANHKAAA